MDLNPKGLLRILALACATAVLIPILPGGEPSTGANSGIQEQPLTRRSLPAGPTMFTRLTPDETGVRTENPYDDPRMWSSRFYANATGETGTGVAIGDFDNDGRPDIFAVSKTRSCRLFRNLGDWKFQDVTEQAGLLEKGEAAGEWKQGATWADVNNDGWLDLFVCRYDAPCLLYINQRDGTFKEEAAARGLAVKDACVMGAFCDYDRDGWLDVFVQTNLLDPRVNANGQRNYLFHNHGDGTFTNVTEKAGIAGEAQGHSATWWDYDGDGWPDLYVANDFAAPDKLYRNNRDGTFTNVIDRVVPHMPYSAMGSDLGDVNNDGLVDLLVSEMAPTTHEKDQRSVAVMRSPLMDPPEGSAQAPQLMRNALYLNTGTGRMLEAACLAGIAATDWTWSVRLEDLDNDGRLDLFVPNGMYRESHNADLNARKAVVETEAQKVRLERTSPVLAERNLAFRNRGDLRFVDVSAKWGLDETGVSFGAAFGDLDGDGDLDLVYSNFDRGITLLRNDAAEGHRLVIALHGRRSNRFGIGAKVRIETDAGVQVRELVLARGLLSSSEPIVHFGLGPDTRVNRLVVTWPSGVVQAFTDLPVDRKLTITESEGTETAPPPTASQTEFAEVAESAGIAVTCLEPPVDETVQQPLLPMRQNRRGPSVAIGDLNGDGRDDIVIGGTTANPARVFFAAAPARYTSVDASFLASSGPLDDGPVLLFDVNGDGAIDLLRTRAGTNLPAGVPEYQPKLYLNDGKGGFRAAAEGWLPALSISAGAAVAGDFDRDGKLDVFIGGRVMPGQYPVAPQSALLANRGGRFEDVTDAMAPGLKHVGMVASALWSDVDGDGWLDLLVTLEWGHVKYFHNIQGHGFEDWTERAGFAAAGTGWWTSIAAADFNGDGRIDYVVGNVGLNTPYTASPEHPALLFSGDFSDEGYPQLVEAYYEGGRLYPRRTRAELGAVIPSILRRYRTNDAYAKAALPEILGEDRLAKADRFAATELRSGVFLSQADGTFRFEPLPRLAQISPLQGVVAGDFDGDGKADIIAVQNSYAPIPSVGRFDGGLGVVLPGDGRGGFLVVPPARSGFVVPGDAKALATIDLGWNSRPVFVVTRNNATVLAFQDSGGENRRWLRVVLRGLRGNPTGIGSRIRVEYADGSSQTVEVDAGSGYWSQTTAARFFGSSAVRPPVKILVRWPSGLTTSESPSREATDVVMTEPSK